MPLIRLLVSVAGEIEGDAGDVVRVTGSQAAAWADGERAELVRSTAAETPEGGQAVPERAPARTRTRKPTTRKG
ncbi:hypothetical protein [Streptomyces sp. NPDC001268]|uniref:hypothetical protein n=1 Tax=Streptomyces sp. NPDC001268 TaxID=3364553 RepID=UPI00368E55ED